MTKLKNISYRRTKGYLPHFEGQAGHFKIEISDTDQGGYNVFIMYLDNMIACEDFNTIKKCQIWAEKYLTNMIENMVDQND